MAAKAMPCLVMLMVAMWDMRSRSRSVATAPGAASKALHHPGWRLFATVLAALLHFFQPVVNALDV